MISLGQQITAAVGAHGLWKGRLRAAVDKAASDLHTEAVRDDHQCSFGKWLHGADLDPKIKRSKHYGTCLELHRRFHVAAAEVLLLALAGKKREASGALGADGEFHKASLALTRAMLAWRAARLM